MPSLALCRSICAATSLSTDGVLSKATRSQHAWRKYSQFSNQDANTSTLLYIFLLFLLSPFIQIETAKNRQVTCQAKSLC